MRPTRPLEGSRTGYDASKLVVVLLVGLVGAVLVSSPRIEPEIVVEQPALETPTDGAVVESNFVPFHGRGTPESIVELLINDQISLTKKVGLDGRWNMHYDFLDPGVKRARVRALLPSGAKGEYTPNRSFRVEFRSRISSGLENQLGSGPDGTVVQPAERPSPGGT